MDARSQAFKRSNNAGLLCYSWNGCKDMLLLLIELEYILYIVRIECRIDLDTGDVLILDDELSSHGTGSSRQ